MTAHGPCETSGVGADSADVEAIFGRALAVDFAFGLDHADHVQSLPQRTAGHTVESAQGAVATGLQATVITLARLHELRVQARVILGIAIDECLLDLIGQGALIALERQGIVTAATMTCSAILVWQPIASMVTIHPFNTRSLSNRGIAAISLDFASLATCPSTTRFAVAHVLTCIAVPSRRHGCASGARTRRQWRPLSPVRFGARRSPTLGSTP